MNKNNYKKFKSIVLRTAILSTALALSGCSTTTKSDNTQQSNTQYSDVKPTITAIVKENDKILIIDLKKYEKYIKYLGYSNSDGMSRDKVWVLTTTNNDVLTFDNDDVISFIYSVDSHEKAFTLANYFYGENIEDYSDVIASYKLIHK